jgi:O-antigen ligase
MARRRTVGAKSGRELFGAERAALVVLAAGLLVIPTIVAGGLDAFRLPKELAFRAEAVALLTVAVFWATSRRRTWTLSWRPELLIAAAIVSWTLVTVATSTNRQLSVDSSITVVAAAVIFVATCVAAQKTSIVAVDALMVACCANAALVILQELKIWTPFPLTAETTPHYGSVALLGNANDVGMFLVAPAIAAVVLAATASGKRRWVYAGIAVLLAAGIAASATRTALGALVAALIVFAAGHSRRAALASGAILALLTVIVLSPATSIGRGVRELADAAPKRDYERLFSERLLPFLTAIEMTRDHPLLGIGPGCFKYHYMAYRVALENRYPKEWTRGWPANWGEVHNDHLQVAAEAGLPGYALFLAAIAIGGGLTWRRLSGGAPAPAEGVTLERTFGRALRWPLATVVFVICLAQFPLELAAPRLMIITLAALCLTWDRDDVAS